MCQSLLRLSFLWVIILFGCEKDNNYIPDVAVNFSIPISDYRISSLNNAGSAVVISNEGVAGIILYRKNDGQIVAYDRCSSVNPEQRCAVNLDSPTITATDPCSGAIFLLNDGYPAKLATRPLKQYQVSVTSSQLIVFN